MRSIRVCLCAAVCAGLSVLCAACGSLLSSAEDSERSPLPPDFNGQDGGGGEPGGNLPHGGVIKSAEYSRAARTIALMVEDQQQRDLILSLYSADGIAVVGGMERQLPGGQGELSLELDFSGAAPDRGALYIFAGLPGGPKNGLGEVRIDAQRPVYFSAIAFDPLTCMLSGALDAFEGAQLTLTATAPEGFSFSDEGVLQLNGGGLFSLEVEIAPVVLQADASTLTVTDQHGFSQSRSLRLRALPQAFAPDRLYAYALPQAAGGEDLRCIVVATGVTAHPLRYLSGCRLVLPDCADYVPGSLNVGAPGGNAWAADGLWQGAAPQGFLEYPDSFVRETLIAYGWHAYDFNITPLSGAVGSALSGELFNFEVSLGPGEHPLIAEQHLRFQLQDGPRRTFYTDASEGQWTWSESGNDYPGVLNGL